jgi:hypothetical protein
MSLKQQAPRATDLFRRRSANGERTGRIRDLRTAAGISSFDGDFVEAQLAHDTKNAPAARRDGAAPAWQQRQEADFKLGCAPVKAGCGLACLLRFLTNNYELKGQSV